MKIGELRVKFSFIVPVYNCENYLPECVDSIQKIGAKDFEILLVDDGSTDRSGQLCDELAAKYDEIRCIHQENQGASAARNHGLQMASGDYVIFLDSDDVIDSMKMADLMYIVENDDTIDLTIYGMSFDYYWAGKCYRSEQLYYPHERRMKPSQWQESFSELFAHNSISSSCNKVFQNRIIKEHGISFRQDMFLYEDLEFVLHYLSYCEDIYTTSEIIYHYRQSEDEGNAGRRLRRIGHLPVLVDQIEAALDLMIARKHAEEQQKQMKSILLSLYLVIAREKVSVSPAKEIRTICSDFAGWLRGRDLQIPQREREFVDHMLHGRVYRLIFQCSYTAIRHKVAVRVKNTGLYQKCAGMRL